MIKLRPSAAAIWAGAGCTAYPSRSAEFYERDTDNTAAETGTAAHWVAECVLLGRSTPDQLIGTTAPNGVMVTGEMCDAVEVYTLYVNGLRGAHNIEQPVDVFKGCHGTPDLWTYDPQTGTLHVVDYKHGIRGVDPVENWQLSLYAAGILKHEGVAADNVRLTVVQPRSYSAGGSVRHWDTTPKTVEDMRIIATTRAAEAHANPVARSGSNCRYCPARHACPAAIDAGVQLYEAATEAAPYDLEPAEMGVQYQIILRAREQLGFLVDAYEAKIKATLYGGGRVPGYELQQKLGRPEWAVDEKEIKALGDMMGVDLCPPTPLTPSKAIKKGVDKGVINAYTQQHSKGHDLKTVNLTQAKRIFS